MCEPTTIAIAAIGALQFGMSIYQSRQADVVPEANAQIAENNAERVEQVGRVNEHNAREDMRRQMSRQRAAIAAAGLDLSSGSSIDLGIEAGEQAYLDAQAVRVQTEDSARGYRTDAALSRLEGDQRRRAGNVNAFTSLARTGGALVSAGAFG